MSTEDPIDTDLLSAWLDDELPPAERARVDTWLRDHPEGAARVRLWAADRDALRARLEPLIAEPVPAHLTRLVLGRGRDGWGAWRWQAAAAVALLALGAALGAGGLWSWQRVAGPTALATAPAVGWPMQAALAHVVYVPEVRHPVEVDVMAGDADTQRKQEEHLARWLTKRLDRPVHLFDLRDQGFRLVGGRLLPDPSGPSAQLMYQQADGPRVTVYLRRPDSAGQDVPAAFRHEQQGRLGMFYWVSGGTGYALVGELPRERLLALAEAIYRQLPGEGPP